MGQIGGAALGSHHPGLMQCEDFRRLQGAGEDSDLIAGYARLRRKIEAAQPDVVMIFDSHWFTTGYHRAISHPDLGRQYPTINLVKQLRLELADLPVVTVSSCQNCEWSHFLQSGEVIGDAIRRSGYRVLLLASGALSHRFNGIDWKPKHPRIFHESNVSRPENIESDKQAIALFAEGRHDLILQRWDADYRKKPWEAFGAHYLQMLGALGGAACTARGEQLSAYENARGTGNVHIWFDTP